MKYYKFTAATPFTGTENEYYVKFEQVPKEDKLAEIADEYARQNGEDFEYLVTGWGGDNYEDKDEEQEALDNYYADCSCVWEEITEKEWKENGNI